MPPPKHSVKRRKTTAPTEEQILFVKVAPDKEISVYVNVADATVLALMLKIYAKTGLPPDQIIPCLRTRTSAMNPSAKLSDYGIQEYDTMDLVVHGMMWVVMEDGAIQEMEDGRRWYSSEESKKFAIQVNSIDTIRNVKRKIWFETGLFPGRIELGKFPEQVTLSELNIGFGSTLLVQVLPEEEDHTWRAFWNESASHWRGRGIPGTGRPAMAVGWR